jgi:two-component system response regulator AtoC
MKCHFVDSRIDFFSALAEKLGSEFEFAPHSPAAVETFNQSDVILIGIPSSSDPLFQSRIALLNRITRTPGASPVVATLPQSERHTPRLVFEAGAYDCFVETVSIEEIRIVLRRAAKFKEMTEELGLLRSEAPTAGFRNVIGSNPKMRAIYSFAARVANSDATILITGETGTGKDLLARSIHEASPRISQPFVAVACSSLPEHLIEAELFGHERGAFTGANSSRQGRFEAAQNGTLFLDEVGELSPSLQVKLLRVLQERVFERLGSNTPRRFN